MYMRNQIPKAQIPQPLSEELLHKFHSFTKPNIQTTKPVWHSIQTIGSRYLIRRALIHFSMCITNEEQSKPFWIEQKPSSVGIDTLKNANVKDHWHKKHFLKKRERLVKYIPKCRNLQQSNRLIVWSSQLLSWPNMSLFSMIHICTSVKFVLV